MLAAGGALASCAWAQGIVQGGVCTAFRELSMRMAMAGGGDFPAFPVFFARAALEPAVVVLLTAAAVAAVDAGASRALQPMSRPKTEAAAEALESARRRSSSLFSLELGEPTLAADASAEFGQQVETWNDARRRLARKDLTASFGRAAVAASVFAASGGCLVAPVVASLGGAVADLPAAPEPCKRLLAPLEASPIEWAAKFSLFAVAWACASAAIETLPYGLQL